MKKDKIKPLKTEKKPKQKHSFILIIGGSVLAIIALIVCFSNYYTVHNNNKEIEKISSEISEVSENNDKLESFLADDNYEDYVEKVAREQYDYAKPGEKVYYDSSYGK